MRALRLPPDPSFAPSPNLRAFDRIREPKVTCSIPRLQPWGHRAYWPAHPSPLGPYVYTAEDLEVDDEVEDAFTAAIAAEEEANGGGDLDELAFDFDEEEVVAGSAADIEEGEVVEERPRKRRRIEVERDRGSGGDVDVTIDYSRRATAHMAMVGRGDHAPGPTSVPRTMTDAGWSFRPLDEDEAMEEGSGQHGGRGDEIEEDVEDGDEGAGDEGVNDPQLDNTSMPLHSETEHRDRVTRASETPHIRQPPDIDASSPSPPALDSRAPAPASDTRSEAIAHAATDIQRSSRSNTHEQHRTPTPPRPGSQNELSSRAQTSPTRTSALSGPVEAGSL